MGASETKSTKGVSSVPVQANQQSAISLPIPREALRQSSNHSADLSILKPIKPFVLNHKYTASKFDSFSKVLKLCQKAPCTFYLFDVNEIPVA